MTEILRRGPLRGPGYWSWVNAIISVLGLRSAAAAAAFLGNFLVARHLGPEGYGRFFMLFTIMAMVAGLTGPAIDTCLVRFAARHIQPKEDRSLPYFKFILYVKCLILSLTMAISFVVAKPILAMYLADTPAGSIPWHAVVLAFFGGAVVSMWGFAQSYFQSHQKFGRFAGYEFLSSALRLGLVVMLIKLDSRNFNIYLFAYIMAPLTMFVLSWSELPGKVFRARTSLAVGRELFQFGKWVFLAAFVTTITQRLDLFLLNWEPFNIPKDAIGRYSAAVSIALAGELVLLTFYSVLLPKASQLRQPAELIQFIAQFRIPSLLFSLALALVIPFSGLLVRLTFGPTYYGAEVYFSILLLGVIVSVACAPAITALYALGNSRIVAGFEVARLAITLSIGVWAAPRYGVWGMAGCMAGVRAGTSIATYLAAHRKIKRLSRRAVSGDADAEAAGRM